VAGVDRVRRERMVVRASKYRHVFGKAQAKESWYEGIQGAGINAPDSNLVACNAKYFALAWKGGGGEYAPPCAFAQDMWR